MKNFLAIIIFILGSLPAWVEGGGLLYLVHTIPQKVYIYNPDSSKRVGVIEVGNVPLGIALSPDNKWIAVSHRQGSGELPNILWIIDMRKGEALRKIEIPLTRYRERGEVFLLFSRDGKKLYAVDSSTGFLDVVSASDWKLVKKVVLGVHPQNPFLSPDGKKLYVPNLYSRKVLILDTDKDEVVDSIEIDGFPSAVAMGSDRKIIFVADMENHRVLFIDLATRKMIKDVSVGSSPTNLIFTKKGFLYVLNTHSNSMSIIDAEKKENIKTLAIGILPKKMTLDPAGKRLYVVSDDASISVVDTLKQKRLKNIPTDITPVGVVFAPARKKEKEGTKERCQGVKCQGSNSR